MLLLASVKIHQLKGDNNHQTVFGAFGQVNGQKKQVNGSIILNFKYVFQIYKP